MMTKTVMTFFLLLIVVPFCLVSQSGNIADQSTKIVNIDSVYQVLNSKMDQLEKENRKLEAELMQQRNDKANTIINWSGWIFTMLAVLFGIAGFIGLREFQSVRQTERKVKEKLEEINIELDKIQNYRKEIDNIVKRQTEITFHLNQAISLYHEGKYLAAREYSYKVLELDPHHIEALFNIGRSLFRERKFDEANIFFNKILEIDPKNSNAYLGLAITESDINKERALSLYQKAVELNPKNTYALIEMGIYYRDMDNLDEAFRLFLKAYSILPLERSCFLIGLIYYVKGDEANRKKYFDEAKFLAHQQIEKVQGIHWAYYLLGIIAGLNNDMDNALTNIKTAMDINSAPAIRKDTKRQLLFLQKHIQNDKNIKQMISLLGDDV